MQKILLSLAAAVISLTAVAAPAEVAVIEFKKVNSVGSVSNYYQNVENTYKMPESPSKEWKTVNFGNNNKGWDYIGCGHGTYAAVATVTTQFPIPESVTSITINYNTFTGAAMNDLQVQVADAADATEWTTVATVTNGNVGDYSVDITNGPADKYWRLRYDMVKNKNAAIKINKITVYGESGAVTPKLPADLSFGGVEAVETGSRGVLENAPVLSNPNNLPVVWSSSAPIVASVDADGVVTINDWGTATITAYTAGNDQYAAGRATYTVSSAPVAKSWVGLTTYGEESSLLEMTVGFPATVTAVGGNTSYVYIVDPAGNHGLIYINNKAHSYNAGDVLAAGWKATYSPYKGLPQIKPVGTLPAVEGTAEVVYEQVNNLAATDLNRPVVLQKVTFTAATPADRVVFNGTAADGTELSFYNAHDLQSVEPGVYNVLAVGSVSNDNFEIMPLAYTPVENENTSVGSIAAEGAAEYFNLQGQKVANAEKGIFIRVSGGKAVKVVK